MSMKELQEAFDIIEQLNSKDFFSGPKEIELICSAEEALNLIFPPSYKVFLEKYGAGGVNGSEIYGLTKSSKKPFLTPGVPDAIWLTLDERKDDYLPKHFIIISDRYRTRICAKNYHKELKNRKNAIFSAAYKELVTSFFISPSLRAL
jgi:hypothetical protein